MRVSSEPSSTGASRACPSDTPAPSAPCSAMPASAASRPATAAPSSTPAGPARRAGGGPDEQPEEDGADEQQQRAVVQAAGDPVGALDRRAGRRAREQVGHLGRVAPRGDRLADAERKAAGDGMAVGGDDPVGRRVHAAAEPVAHADGDAALRPAGMADLAAVDARAVLVEHAHGAEAHLDGLVEVQPDRGRGGARPPSSDAASCAAARHARRPARAAPRPARRPPRGRPAGGEPRPAACATACPGSRGCGTPRASCRRQPGEAGQQAEGADHERDDRQRVAAAAVVIGDRHRGRGCRRVRAVGGRV